MSEAAHAAMVRRHKAALTRARNYGSLTKIIDVCDAALAEFDQPENRWADGWPLWRDARDHAVALLVRESW